MSPPIRFSAASIVMPRGLVLIGSRGCAIPQYANEIIARAASKIGVIVAPGPETVKSMAAEIKKAALSTSVVLFRGPACNDVEPKFRLNFLALLSSTLCFLRN